jgi:hypothetical protein
MNDLKGAVRVDVGRLLRSPTPAQYITISERNQAMSRSAMQFPVFGEGRTKKFLRQKD